jgi:hypothetical protein
VLVVSHPLVPARDTVIANRVVICRRPPLALRNGVPKVVFVDRGVVVAGFRLLEPLLDLQGFLSAPIDGAPEFRDRRAAPELLWRPA